MTGPPVPRVVSCPACGADKWECNDGQARACGPCSSKRCDFCGFVHALDGSLVRTFTAREYPCPDCLNCTRPADHEGDCA